MKHCSSSLHLSDVPTVNRHTCVHFICVPATVMYLEVWPSVLKVTLLIRSIKFTCKYLKRATSDYSPNIQKMTPTTNAMQHITEAIIPYSIITVAQSKDRITSSVTFSTALPLARIANPISSSESDEELAHAIISDVTDVVVLSNSCVWFITSNQSLLFTQSWR